uniref:KH RNA binding domain containing, signal transduction associated 2 n=1 Tax=Xiphophorus couchianus TaxID=32473 RepID=A0A3B5M7C2_9TELE
MLFWIYPWTFIFDFSLFLNKLFEFHQLHPSFLSIGILVSRIGKYEGDELKKDADTKKYLDIISNKNIKLSERVLIPIQQYPKVRNYSFKLLDYFSCNANTLCLFVLLSLSMPPGQIHRKANKDYNDEIRQEQLRELSLLNGSDESSRGRSIQGRSLRTTTTASTMGHGGASRRAATPRGTAAATHSKLPKTALTRDLQAPRIRGAAANAGYRPPLLAVTHESYDDYGYEDGYDEEYEDETYEEYDENYRTQTKSPRPILKAPALRLTRGGYRKHPYGRY